MLSDVWGFDIGSKKWEEVILAQEDGPPAIRGLFDADVVSIYAVVVHDGLGESMD